MNSIAPEACCRLGSASHLMRQFGPPGINSSNFCPYRGKNSNCYSNGPSSWDWPAQRRAAGRATGKRATGRAGQWKREATGRAGQWKRDRPGRTIQRTGRADQAAPMKTARASEEPGGPGGRAGPERQTGRAEENLGGRNSGPGPHVTNDRWCVRVPRAATHLPSRNTVRLEPRRATRREATGTPAHRAEARGPYRSAGLCATNPLTRPVPIDTLTCPAPGDILTCLVSSYVGVSPQMASELRKRCI